MPQTQITSVRILSMGIDFALMTVRSDWWQIDLSSIPPVPLQEGEASPNPETGTPRAPRPAH